MLRHSEAEKWVFFVCGIVREYSIAVVSLTVLLAEDVLLVPVYFSGTAVMWS